MINETWILPFLNRKINFDLFETWMTHYQTNYYHCIVIEYESGIRVELVVYYSDEGYVTGIELSKAKFSEYGYGECYDLARNDYKYALNILMEVMPLRGSDKIFEVIEYAIQSCLSYKGFQAKKINQQSVSFHAPDSSIKRVNLSVLKSAFDLVYTDPDICKDISKLSKFTSLLGEENLDMIYTILQTINAPDKLKEEYEQSLPVLKEVAVPTSIRQTPSNPSQEPESNEDYLKILKAWVEGTEEIFIPELLFAGDMYDGFVNDETILNLFNKFKECESDMNRWPAYANALINIFRKAENVDIRIETLIYICEFAQKTPSQYFKAPLNLYYDLTERLAIEIKNLQNANLD